MMQNTDGNKLDRITISDGGKAGERRQHAEIECERALRALFFAMRNKEGASINKNFRNVACGQTAPWRVLMRRFREAKLARNTAHNYPLMKAAVREMDRYVDALHGVQHHTGEHTPPRAA